MSIQWNRPKSITTQELILSTNVNRLLPSWDEIPEDYKRERGDAKKWVNIVEDWFFNGISSVCWVEKDEIDRLIAVRHLKAIMGSFEPQHEHKTAGVAYLMSLWFDDVTYERVKKE